ncbi:mannitol-specific phosphotransferase system IIBC component [Streptosporangium album]|uniref:Mannitol-specific phosphotransferase system IIBC component n=1 Tax=Streptosporangium album TaxID=47479 RepID=A0A7W7S3G9_9ACTN|nr:PTS lactose transporter subunit IIB [Streptosporangium album]MBB4943206.1 mannitol-specific phosphotransferase system IIBC component [Streptosporangium album]
MASIESKDIHKIVVACDAGMGSSVMLATQLRKQLKGLPVRVEHTPVNSIPADADVVLCHVGLADRARAGAPGTVLVPFQVFIGDPAVTRLIATIKSGGTVHT